MSSKKRLAVYVVYAVIKILFVLFFFVGVASPRGTAKPVAWNFLVYIASNNDLYRFGPLNVREMERIGSNERVNIFVQMDTFGKKQATRYFIEKGKKRVISSCSDAPRSVSGTKENLFDFAKEITEKYPAEHTALIIWGHGSGPKDPINWKHLYSHMKHVCTHCKDRALVALHNAGMKGIAFNSVAHTYLTNPDLKEVLHKISKELLGGKKIDILGLDACHMAAAEIASQVKSVAKYMVASEEAGPAFSWNYEKILRPFLTRNLSPLQLAQKMVVSYEERYMRWFSAYTQSAVDLASFDLVEESIDNTATLLLELMNHSQGSDFLRLVKEIRSCSCQTTSFIDSDYIDLAHFYKSLYKNIEAHQRRFKNNEYQKLLIKKLKESLQRGLDILAAVIIGNVSGDSVKKADGLLIYFPTRRIHPSYIHNDLAKNTNWYTFLYSYLCLKSAENALD